MSNKKNPSFEDYKINENSPTIKVTMEALEISREDAIKLIKEMNYRVDFPKKKKTKAA